ncbi:TonB-dependent receptor [Massilia glaciei]|uniref:TonB-dependent receptor n=1 Tax=Massilia glaciei TaxID=1524097 RepID=A0A2U2HKJ2_9BURK|nr:TonB-dependent receptor [Massilia glaciei]PWF47989.1 TonB-dependent receptor [Massilia glaciei]
MPTHIIFAAAAALCACAPGAAAGPFAPVAPLAEVTIKASRAKAPPNTPATVETIGAGRIAETINTVGSAAALNYLPSVHARERYIGDRNAILVMRVNSSIASAQTLVYADGLLLSNLLNNSFSTAPRWGMVGPDEIDHVDVLYGPFSALYPGNSAGGVVLMTTRAPGRFAARARLDLFEQRFKLYGTARSLPGAHASASFGDKAGAWSWRLSADRLDNHGQPQTFGVAELATPAGPAAATTISGELRDTDPGGRARIVTSAIGADHTVQHTGTLRIGLDISPSLRASYTLGLWQNRSDAPVQSYLRDGAGAPVYNTARAGGAGRYVRFAGDPGYYTLAGASPSHAESEHSMHGLALAWRDGGAWQWQAVASAYRQHRDASRSAANNGTLHDPGTGAHRPGGTLTSAGGTGWANLDVRAESKRRGAHRFSVGFHSDRYALKSATTRLASDWLQGAAAQAPSSNSYGKTSTQALYAQDNWDLDPVWLLVAGLRLERWRAYHGSNFNLANAPSYRQLDYADRARTDASPKLSLAYRGLQDWGLRASLARAVRFPTVAEIFQVISLPDNVKQNDPNLKAEDVLAAELTAERAIAHGMLRLSLFGENKRGALIAQTDTTVTPTISSIQNVDRVRTRGAEAVFALRELQGFDLNGSVTHVKSTITRDSRNPGLAGSDQPRIPDWRATLVALYRQSARLSYSASYRYSGRQHNALLNTNTGNYKDVNPKVYGAVSRYSLLDAKIVYKFARHWSASAGVNNITSFKYYVNPNPYPQRTFFTSLAFDHQGTP